MIVYIIKTAYGDMHNYQTDWWTQQIIEVIVNVNLICYYCYDIKNLGREAGEGHMDNTYITVFDSQYRNRNTTLNLT